MEREIQKSKIHPTRNTNKMTFTFSGILPKMLLYLEDLSESIVLYDGDVGLLPGKEDSDFGPSRYGLDDWGPSGHLFPCSQAQLNLMLRLDPEKKKYRKLRSHVKTLLRQGDWRSWFVSLKVGNPCVLKCQDVHVLELLLNHLFVPNQVLLSGFLNTKTHFIAVFRNWFTLFSHSNLKIHAKNHFATFELDDMTKRMIDQGLLKPTLPSPEKLAHTYNIMVDSLQRGLFQLPSIPLKKELKAVHKAVFGNLNDMNDTLLQTTGPHAFTGPTLLNYFLQASEPQDIIVSCDFYFMGIENDFIRLLYQSLGFTQSPPHSKKRKI